MRMHQEKRVLASTLSILAATVTAACSPEPEAEAVDADVPLGARIGNVATAELEPASGSNVSGTVTFAQLDDGLQVDASISGLVEGEHGFHLHENGDCSAPDASSAGGHWSPGEDPHGAPSEPASEHHAGDLGNITAGPGGMANLTREDAELSLAGDYGVVGRAVVIHRGSDDLETQPSGDAGERVACGVIEWGTGAG